ncbi:heat-inducible transcriptional repressor HrcA [Candidatus Oleimmundimicrobium sp.]|uniref:heat-inducible transcriptional repressor HrcA n=1 Tax=Candidatus Oleimmundimicrobium sp. TaxID=3060597 RepID=UPI00272813C3|nr:heat-inducible transcriptional repressor HrcA [Candidatus Oleimmundimicrobium sp.]MDO8885851.1 heat-inducible transcriptional repressor HrcA [Candidatus Oleimmundimicrobium sp.]
MQALDSRKEFILKTVVEDYIKSVEPVGSQRIVENYGLKVSSATVRNELVYLEKAGYLLQPHTSAGRIPTDSGYRYYVNELLKKERNFIFSEEGSICELFSAGNNELDVLMRETSHLLSRLTKYVAFVFAPSSKVNYLKHIDLILIRPHTVLIVVIMNTGYVSKKIIDLDYELSQKCLRNLEILLNERLDNLRPKEIMEIGQNLIEFSPEVRDVAGRVMRHILDCFTSEENEQFFLGGTSNILLQPEFQNSKKIQLILEILEQGDIIANLYKDTSKPGFVSVRIGHENLKDEVDECSLVFGTYGAKGQSLGALGVLGPTRLDYFRSISVVESISKSLSYFLESLYS